MFRRLAVVTLALAGIQGAFAHADPAMARGARHAAMILDANTGAVLHAEDADEPRHPASLTKMMTLYLTFETLESGRLSMSDRVKISQEAASQAPSKLDLEPGEDISVSDAVRALITKSANDVAVALAEKVGGSEKNFVRLMNTRARELGMMKTHFENASGLPNDDQVTTARDMITLGLRLQDHFPAYYPLFATRAFTFNRASYRNHNTMLNSFQGVDGIKTGYTRKSGFNLVSSVRRGGRHVVGAVFGGASAATRNGEMRMLMSRALTRASTVKTRKPAPALIAKLKSAPKIAERPKPKEKPKFQVADAAPVFAEASQPQPKALPAPTPISKPVAAQAPVAQPVADPAPQMAAAPIDVFKVKRVMVAPRQGPQAPPPSADETTDMAPEVGSSPSDSVSVTPPDAAPFKIASADAAPADAIAQTFAAAETEDSVSETIVPKLTPAATEVTYAAPARLPSPLDNRIAMLGASDTVLVEPEEKGAPAEVLPVAQPVSFAAAPTKPAPERTTQPAPRPSERIARLATPVERGRAPSSLQAQAAQMPVSHPIRVANLAPTASLPRGALPARFEIQIGAYSSIDEAQRALTSAQSRAGRLLSGYASVTHPVQKAGRQVFRARFSGFDSTRASSTCLELRRQSIDCFVMTAE